MSKRNLWILGLGLLLIAPLRAEAAEPQIGHPAPSFELTDIQGQTHRLSDYAGKIVVLHFQSCRCPWDVAYQPTLNKVAAQFGSAQGDPSSDSGVEFVFLAINSNRSESVDQIKAYADSGKITYPVLKDPGNKVADAYAATTTPHIYIVNNDGQQTLAYMGGIEKAPLSPEACGNSDEQYLVPVLTALREGSILPVTSTQNIGCSIKRVQ